jgi:hypothetical protein
VNDFLSGIPHGHHVPWNLEKKKNPGLLGRCLNTRTGTSERIVLDHCTGTRHGCVSLGNVDMDRGGSPGDISSDDVRSHFLGGTCPL